MTDTNYEAITYDDMLNQTLDGYHLHSEIAALDMPSYYVRKLPALGTTIKVYEYDTTTSTRKNELSQINGYYNSLLETEFCVDTVKGLFYMCPKNIGKTFEYLFYTSGDTNPFNVSSNITTYIRKVLEYSSLRVCDGLYMYRYDSDESYNWRIKGGSIIFNDELWVINDSVFDIRYISPPTISNQFRCYYIFINNNIITSFGDKKSKIISKIGIMPSSGIHTTMNDALTDSIERYNTTYSSSTDVLNLMYVYVNILDGDYRVWIVYPKEGRTI